jgi:hypothetical protein
MISGSALNYGFRQRQRARPAPNGPFNAGNFSMALNTTILRRAVNEKRLSPTLGGPGEAAI